MKSIYNRKCTIYLTEGIRKDLEKIAVEKGTKASILMREVLISYLKNREA